MNTAGFLENFDFNIDAFLSNFTNVNGIRKAITRVKGIGIKITSHWLRNIGYKIPIIDIHIKNLLYYFNLIKNPLKSYIKYEQTLISLANILNMDLFILDLSLWFFGKNNCGNRRCLKCSFKKNCKKIELKNN